jgi:hypothetical protein
MVFTTCPSCRNELEIEGKYLGKGVMCPYCQKLFVPPLPNATLGIAAVSLAGLAVLIELFTLVYFLTGANWHAGFLSVDAVRAIMGLLRFVGLIVSWIGIACAGFALTKKRRRKNAAKWGLIVNLALNLFVCGYFVAKPRLPQRAPSPVEEEEKAPEHPEARL